MKNGTQAQPSRPENHPGSGLKVRSATRTQAVPLAGQFWPQLLRTCLEVDPEAPFTELEALLDDVCKNNAPTTIKREHREDVVLLTRSEFGSLTEISSAPKTMPEICANRSHKSKQATSFGMSHSTSGEAAICPPLVTAKFF
jgi:PHD/YefM family antitoxin component YafN of YafNO toxin-antitoxin module